jgi:hypothetical protein
MSNDIRYNSDLSVNRWLGYFDLLGVKDLYKTRNNISIFVAISTAIEQLKERATAWDNVEYVWFSDTFIVYTADDSGESFVAIDEISQCFFYFLIDSEIPVRGAMSSDAFYADKENDLFFGKALIEAYEYGEAQDWIGFLLCPSAERRLDQLGSSAKKLLDYAYTKIPYNKRLDHLNQSLPACIIGNRVSVNDRCPIIGKLDGMKRRITSEDIRAKYDRAIEFILQNKRVLPSEIIR